MQIKHQTNKVGVVPWRLARGDGDVPVIEFLVHQPVAKRDAGETVAWGMVRGTVQFAEKTGDAAQDDIRSLEVLQDLWPEVIEDHRETLLREAEEELGIAPEDIIDGSIADEGLHIYASQTPGRGTYAIHAYSMQIRDVAVEVLQQRARDHSQAVAWKSLPELREMAEAGAFKSGYLAMLEAVEKRVTKVM